MIVYLNGNFVPEEQAVVSVFDRAFLYGDGLFETMLVFDGRPFRWNQHIERLQRGAEFLKIRLPFPPEKLCVGARELIARHDMPDALLRLTLSRGVGMRGYSPLSAAKPTVVMSLHPAPATRGSVPARTGNASLRAGPVTGAPPRWKLVTSSFRLPAQESLAQFKTCNKLPQILARAEADAAGADEALLLNTDGFVVEGASSNLFWVDGETVCTPPLASGVLAGVTRSVVLEICQTLGLAIREAGIARESLCRAQGVFLSLSSYGVVETQSLDGSALTQSPLVERIRLEYWKLVRDEAS